MLTLAAVTVEKFSGPPAFHAPGRVSRLEPPRLGVISLSGVGGWQRFIHSFEGEPAWLVVLVSLLIVVAVIFIFQKLLRFSAWILAFVLVGSGFLVGIYFAFFW